VRIERDALTGWATELSDAQPAFTREDLLAHHELVAAIFAREEAILPARFPTFADDTHTLCDRLQSRQDALRAQLERVRGCCELAVTALWMGSEAAPPPVEADSPGRRYMYARRQALAGSDRRRARARELADQLESRAGPDLVSVQHRLCPSQGVGLSSALLVRRSRAADIKASLVRTEQDVRILVNGPWPPYTFAAVGSD
jgi:hypothetical protein